MSAGFTPGPWAITSVSQDTGAIGIAKDRILIAEAHNGYSFMDVVQDRHPREQFANARLIAAAPELYEALDDFEKSAAAIANTASEIAPEIVAKDGARAWVRCLTNARAALAKARGEG